MALSATQHAARENKIGASFAPYLLAGDADKILQEWKRLVGAPDYEAENLEDVWAVQLGSYLESFALDWHQRRTGRVLTRRGESVPHPVRSYVAATLDCFREDDRCVIDCKVIGGWRRIDDACAFYTPQMIVQAGCVEAQAAALLIVHGGAEPAEYPITWDADYEAEVWRRIDNFYRAVCDLAPPVEMPAIAAPVPAVREADLSRSNAWVSAATEWLGNRAAAKTFSAAEKSLKALVEPDVKRAFGGGIEAIKNKAGAISIREG